MAINWPAGGPYPYRIEEFEPSNRIVIVLGHFAAVRPASEAFAAAVEMKPQSELRLRHVADPKPPSDRRGMNYTVDEFEGGSVVAMHAITGKLELAQAAHGLLCQQRPNADIVIRQGCRMIRGPRD